MCQLRFPYSCPGNGGEPGFCRTILSSTANLCSESLILMGFFRWWFRIPWGRGRGDSSGDLCSPREDGRSHGCHQQHLQQHRRQHCVLCRWTTKHAVSNKVVCAVFLECFIFFQCSFFLGRWALTTFTFSPSSSSSSSFFLLLPFLLLDW